MKQSERAKEKIKPLQNETLSIYKERLANISFDETEDPEVRREADNTLFAIEFAEGEINV